jgi:hypothetical protein
MSLGRWTGDVYHLEPDGTYLKVIEAYYPPDNAYVDDYRSIDYMVLLNAGWPETRNDPAMVAGWSPDNAVVPILTLPVGEWVAGWAPFMEPWPHQTIGNDSVWIMDGDSWVDENVKYRVAHRSEVEPGWTAPADNGVAIADIGAFAGTTAGKVVISLGLYVLYEIFFGKGKK